METQQIISRSEKTLQLLLEIMQDEQQAVQSADSDAVVELTRQKQQCLDQLAHLQEALLQLFDDSAENNPELESIHHYLHQCREQNQVNQSLTAQGIRVVDQSLAFLEAAMQIGTARLYSEDGRASRQTIKRNLGAV